MRTVTGVVLVFLVAAVATSGCKRKDPPAPPRPVASAPAPDHLAPGEIPAGTQHAFTLLLPLHSQVKLKTTATVQIGSSHSLEEVASFTRARVSGGTSASGASETRFDNVTAKEDPSRVLTIEIRRAPGFSEFRTQMIVHDVTPAPEPPNTTDEDRWRKAGLTPDGKLLDPKHMQ